MIEDMTIRNLSPATLVREGSKLLDQPVLVFLLLLAGEKQ
jgi:hypothetical protein